MKEDGSRPEAGSQTLARGLEALAMIGEAATPLTVAEVGRRLAVHRSMAYRLVRTLEQFGFVERNPAGGLEIGARLAAISRNASRNLQSVALPEMLAAANDLDLTVFLVVFDGEAAVTLASVEPQGHDASLRQRPGARQSVDHGAPGRVIRSQLDPVKFPPAAYEISHGEVIEGLSAIAVPLVVPGGRPASLAALHLSGISADLDGIAERLRAAASRIQSALP